MVFVNLLMDVKVSGIENFPPIGPYIVVGNHVSSLEPILMLIYTPHQLEFLGSGDIPIDPRISVFSNLYKFVPIMRGQVDQTGFNTALDILKQKGVLGIFPEGGIWEKNLKEPKLGTSWISYKSGANVIPIGFVGMNGGLQKALTFKKPKVEVHIGEPILYEDLFSSEDPIKIKISNAANKIIEHVAALLPQEEIINPSQHVPRELEYFLISNKHQSIERLSFIDQPSFSILIEHPVIMDVFRRNLKLKVSGLMKRNEKVSINEISIALVEILQYLEINPGFLPYRFGIENSIKMKNGIVNLKNNLETFDFENTFLSINPI